MKIKNKKTWLTLNVLSTLPFITIACQNIQNNSNEQEQPQNSKDSNDDKTTPKSSDSKNEVIDLSKDIYFNEETTLSNIKEYFKKVRLEINSSNEELPEEWMKTLWIQTHSFNLDVETFFQNKTYENLKMEKETQDFKNGMNKLKDKLEQIILKNDEESFVYFAISSYYNDEQIENSIFKKEDTYDLNSKKEIKKLINLILNTIKNSWFINNFINKNKMENINFEVFKNNYPKLTSKINSMSKAAKEIIKKIQLKIIDTYPENQDKQGLLNAFKDLKINNFFLSDNFFLMIEQIKINKILDNGFLPNVIVYDVISNFIEKLICDIDFIKIFGLENIQNKITKKFSSINDEKFKEYKPMWDLLLKEILERENSEIDKIFSSQEITLEQFKTKLLEIAKSKIFKN